MTDTQHSYDQHSDQHSSDQNASDTGDTGVETPGADSTPSSPWHDLDGYIGLPRLGGVALAPSGEWLLATVSQLDVAAKAWTSSLWRVPVDGGAARRLTRGTEGDQASAILRDDSVVFTSKRDVPKSADDDPDEAKALWCLPASGGEAYVLARREGGWQSVLAARDADVLVAGIGVHRGITDLALDATRRADRTKRGVEAILHTGYPVRYWDHDLDTDTTRFVRLDLPAGDGDLTVAASDITCAAVDHGAGIAPEAAVAPDGTFVVTTQAVRESHGASRSRLVRIDATTGELAAVADEPGVEWESPVLNQQGTAVVALRQQMPTAEQVFDITVHLIDLATGEVREIAAGWDRWAQPVAVSPDGGTVFAVADDDGASPVFALDVASGEVRRLTDEGAFSSVRMSDDGGTLYGVRSSYVDAGTVVAIDVASGTVTDLYSPLADLDLPGRLVRVETTAADGARVPAWLCLPDDASSTAPAPLALWIHGGPLGSWNAWTWRWCPWLLVSQGYAVLLPDPALSTGYGLDFIQRGWGQWGGNSYTDLMSITDAVESRDDIDADRTVAMGGSYGGYMANWVAGHTDRFKAIVTHASLWNLTTFGGTTDAAWYWSHEMSPEMQQANSPHQFVDQITTPMLVIHGDKDYRVPIGEGLALWWALNERWDGPADEFPHRFLYYPNENHWVLTPQHSKIWYQTVREFLSSALEGRAFIAPELL